MFVKVYPVRELTPVTMMDPGSVKRIYGRAFVAGVLPMRVSSLSLVDLRTMYMYQDPVPLNNI